MVNLINLVTKLESCCCSLSDSSPRACRRYREGKAAEALRRWEDAGTAYYSAAQLQPENEELLLLTKHAIEEGRAELGVGQGSAAAAGGDGGSEQAAKSRVLG